MATRTEFKPRRAEPGQVFDYNGAEGEKIRIRADDDGVIHPRNDAERRAADAFGLPVAAKAKPARKAKAKASKPKAETPAPAPAPVEAGDAAEKEDR